MPDLYPMRLRPQFHARVWGSRDLAPLYPPPAEGGEPVGEVWLTGDDCTVENGPLAGTALRELAARFGVKLVGEAAPAVGRFPLLIKFLFPRDKLSMQVHPDDDMAERLGEPCGKTECWYVLAAEPDAKIGLGVRRGVTHAAMEQAIAENRAEDLLNWIEVRGGEMIYCDAGTVHAIGPGCVLVETQQNSDTTYRLYDYGRPRQLHVREGLEAMKERTHAGKVVRDSTPLAGQAWTMEQLILSPWFAVRKLRLRTGALFHEKLDAKATQVFVALNGCGAVRTRAGKATFGKGEAVVVPADSGELQLAPKDELDCLIIGLPTARVGHPRTELN